MATLKHIRKGDTIRDVEAKTDNKFKSINKAKKESRKLQMNQDGALGRGSVMVVDKLPAL